MVPPEYRGEGDFATVQEYAAGPFGDWVRERLNGTTSLEDEFDGLENSQSDLLLSAHIAATIGVLWERFAFEMLGGPIPVAWQGNATIERSYYGALNDETRPLLEASLNRYRTCVSATREAGGPEYEALAEFCRRPAASIEGLLNSWDE